MKRIFSFSIILCMLMSALSLTTFAANDVTIGNVDYVNKNDITVNFSVTGLTSEDYVTILIYKEDDIEGYVDDDIVYINQVSADNNKIELAIPATSADGKYVVLMGGTDVATAKSTYFTITTLIYGDVDNNKIIDINDAVYVLKYSLDVNSVSEELQQIIVKAGNVNGGNVIDINDAVAILKYSLDVNSVPDTDVGKTVPEE